MTDQYPGYDVLAKRRTPSWNEQTRQAINGRLAIPREPRFLSPDLFAVLDAACRRIIPQPTERPPVPLAAYIDAKLFNKQSDGYRLAQMPDQGDTYRRGLAGLDEAARSQHGLGFTAIAPEAQDEVLRQAHAGKLTGGAWQGMPSKTFFEHRLLNDTVTAYYGHPTAWSEIGFGGPASPRGYVRMALNRRDPWEAAEAKPGEEARARRENDHV
ncbi:MAG: gluconate 2-dehydrogenase subunit 3 family protein [Proteobacteria bacterium]|nr:gluconate 2-dehydrogenase subunit 3 family protein [Pseudomonadota bacterium]